MLTRFVLGVNHFTSPDPRGFETPGVFSSRPQGFLKPLGSHGGLILNMRGICAILYVYPVSEQRIALAGAPKLSNPTEAKTRKELIDPALQKAGWDVNNPDQVGLEIPVDGFDPQAWQRLEAELRRLRQEGVPYHAQLPAGVSDYVLYRPNGEIVAVVEAKRASVDPRWPKPRPTFTSLSWRRRRASVPSPS